jgi:D-Tyr-tRNAtyr deacylase
MAQDKSNVQNLGEAISVLVQAVNIAQSKGGVYSFSDAAKINSALNFIEEVSAQAQAPKAEVETEETDKSVEEK